MKKKFFFFLLKLHLIILLHMRVPIYHSPSKSLWMIDDPLVQLLNYWLQQRRSWDRFPPGQIYVRKKALVIQNITILQCAIVKALPVFATAKNKSCLHHLQLLNSARLRTELKASAQTITNITTEKTVRITTYQPRCYRF